ncbi:hypothetical protein [Sediminivirga luteola]|uniref:Uncharacterized protein n=1 Tax=Sediminivirga luteola TaxID=1774748 RepID=A0A8J2XJS8_9MICO|nr:hypothetical protein [Sediminivirga luteola]MCI2266559.1 hypothetical protein [Sediminivirga luteola]GGA07875.1 hypothetical protein GCM10011333_08360 [Sediminivirga luteola]
MSDRSRSGRPKSVSGLLALGVAAAANLIAGFVARVWLAEQGQEDFFGEGFFDGPPLLFLALMLAISGIGVCVLVYRSGKAPGVAFSRKRFVALVFAWIVPLSIIAILGLVGIDPYGHWQLSLVALSIPFLVLSMIVALPFLPIVPRLLQAAGVGEGAERTD